MKIIRNLQKDYTFDTELYIYLKNIPDSMLYHSQHGIRHPFAKYNIVSERVFKAFDEVYETHRVNTINKLKLISIEQMISSEINSTLLREKERLINYKKDGISKLYKNYKELLDSLNAFIDNTYLIIKAFYPPEKVNDKTDFAYLWLKKADSKNYYFYYDKIKSYREHLAPIVNLLKHDESRMGFLENQTEKDNIFGYYIDGIDANGAIGTNLNIHKKYKNMDTAFSFNRDLKYHLVNFYFIAHFVKETIQNIVNTKIPTINTEVEEENNSKIFMICDKISHLPNLFFIDEYEKKLPQVKTDTYEEIELVYPASNYSFEHYTQNCFEYYFSGDGYSKSFRFLYWGM